MKTPPTWEEEFDRWAEDALDTFTNLGNSNHYLSDSHCYDELKIRIINIITSHEATIRQEIGEEVEGVFFEGTTGNASYDTAIKELWGKVFKPKVLAIINQTTKI